GGLNLTSSTGQGLNFGTNTLFYQNNQSFLTSSTTAAGNLTIGYQSATGLDANGGLYNTGIGYQALGNATSTAYNTALGYQALKGSGTVSNTGYNTAVGYQALTVNTTGYENTAIGYLTFANNTTGIQNTAIGNQAGRSNTTGNDNSFFGRTAGLSNTTGNRNLFIGRATGYYNTTASDNVWLGYYAGIGDSTTPDKRSVTDTKTIFIGSLASRDPSVASTTALTNSIAIGYDAKVSSSNSMVLGGVGSNAINVAIGTTSPWAKLSIQNTYGNQTPLFDIASSTSAAYATSSVFRVAASGNLGIGTTSPNWKLSVAGIGSFDDYVRTSYFTATSTTASTFPYASTTALTVSGNSYLGTVSSGTWNGTSISNQYGGTGIDSSALTGLAQIVSGTWRASSTLSAAYGGTGWNSLQANTVLLGNGAGRIATTSAGTDGYVLGLSAGVPTWLATSTLSTITGILTVAKGGTGQTSFGQGWLHSDGSTFTSSTSPTVAYLTATSTTATSTFPYLRATTAFQVGSDYLTDITGTNLSITDGVLNASGGGASPDWKKETNFGALTLTASTTIPIWAKDAIYASSTLTVQGLATFGNATATQITLTNLYIGGDQLNELCGTGLTCASNTLALNATGDWTGTLDTYNGSDLLARANHTGTQAVSTLSNYDWTFLNNYGAINLTGTSTKPIWAQGGLNASSTSNFVYASTTALTVSGNSYLGTVSSGTWNGALIGVTYGGTGWAAIQSGAIPYGNGTNALSTTTAGTDGYVLGLSAGVPTWLATSTLSTITGILTVAK
ncbi:MAG: hypothetical protein AAB262_02380, partial [Elusimicrobiota bacterium]